MKTTILLPIVLFASVCYAQQDTTRFDTIQQNKPMRPDAPIPSSSQPTVSPSDDYSNTSPLLRVRTDAIPSSLRHTLSEDRYRGWDQSPIYHDNKTQEYSIDIRSGDSIQTFRFDRYGKPVTENPKK